MPLNVPMYTPRLPISGGGGVIDLSSKENESKRLIAQALGELLRHQQKQQQQPVKGIIVRGENSIQLINPEDGSLIKDLGPPPKGDKANAALDAIMAMGRISKTVGEDIPQDVLPTELGEVALQSERQKLMGGLGLEEYEVPGVPGEKRSRLGMDWLARDKPAVPPRTGYRKKVESKEIPPKPKEYPDAKWSEEHQMWTIVKNGRLMGVK